MKIGIYEQIINQLFEEKIASIDQKRFYIGERLIIQKLRKKNILMNFELIFNEFLRFQVD